MWHHNQTIAVERAPAKYAPSAMFQEINGPLEFIVPTGIGNFTPPLIDQHQSARLHNRVHKPIVGADERVAVVLQVERIQQG